MSKKAAVKKGVKSEVEEVNPKTKTKTKTKTKEEVTPKTATTEVEEAEFDLQALGTEMNSILFPDDPVDFSEMTDDEVEAQIKADMEQIDPSDPFSDEAKEMLAELGLEIKWKTAGKPAKPAKKAGDKPAKAVKAVRVMSRSSALGTALRELKKPDTIAAVIEKSNEIYVDGGGKDNLKEAKWCWGVVSQALVSMGILDLAGDKVAKLARASDKE